MFEPDFLLRAGLWMFFLTLGACWLPVMIREFVGGLRLIVGGLSHIRSRPQQSSLLSGQWPPDSSFEIPVEELAFWTRFNNDYISLQPQAPKEDEEAAPQQKPPETTVDNPRALFTASAMYDDIIAPYEAVFKTQGIYDCVVTLLKTLDTYGRCPSIVPIGAASQDSEQAEFGYSALFTELGKVPLIDHSFDVAKQMVSILKDTYRDDTTPTLIGPGIVCALAHDLGKIPEFRAEKDYSKYDHPYTSVEKLKELCQCQQAAWFPDVEKAIKSHHSPTAGNDQFAVCLQLADTKARELELLRVTGRETKPLKEWLDPIRFVETTKARINVYPEKAKSTPIFSFRDTVYFEPRAFICLLVELMNHVCMIDLRLYKTAYREAVIREALEVLQHSQHMVSPLMRQNSIGEWFVLMYQNGKRSKGLYIPFCLEPFGLASDFDGKRKGLLALLQEVSLQPKQY